MAGLPIESDIPCGVAAIEFADLAGRAWAAVVDSDFSDVSGIEGDVLGVFSEQRDAHGIEMIVVEFAGDR